jgi:hypothetical protein
VNVGITATRRTRPGEPIIKEEMHELSHSTIYVGGCLGGDCLAARYALEAGHRVHTILPTIWDQLCEHWKEFTKGYRHLVPHTTTWELTPESREPYRARNTLIVQRGNDLLVAFPDKRPQQARSGVTMTINIAKREGVPVKVRVLHAPT